MKRTIILLGIFLTVTTTISAQRLKVNSIVKARHSSFKTEISKYGIMNVENDKNVFGKKRPKNQRFDLGDSAISGTAIAFKQVFSEARLKELIPENRILLSYRASPEGKILEVSFALNPETSVTAAELEALEAAIKDKVSIKLIWRANNKQDANFVLVSQIVHYKAILDGTLKD